MKKTNDTPKTEKTTGGFESVPELKHLEFKSGSGPMSVYEAGEPGRSKVVMLHGAMYDYSNQMFPYLSGYYHLFALDRCPPR